MLHHPSRHIVLALHEDAPGSAQLSCAIVPLRVLQQDDFTIPIIQADDHFLCIDKPPFLRIDAQGSGIEEVDGYHEESWTAETILKKQLIMDEQKRSQESTEPLANITALKQTHQLDANTSGVFLYAKHRFAASEACQLFQERKVKKTYLAIVHGHVNIVKLVQESCSDARVQAPLSCGCCHRSPPSQHELHDHSLRIDAWVQAQSSQRCAVVERPAQDAVSSAGKGHPQAASTILTPLLNTHFGPLQRPVTVVQLRPITGRRHQLRVHCASIGHAIVGDWLYEREPSRESGRMFLHAFRMEMTFPDKALLDRTRKRTKKGKLVLNGSEETKTYIWQTAFPFGGAFDDSVIDQIYGLLYGFRKLGEHVE